MKKAILLLFFLVSIKNYSQEIEFGKVSKTELEEKFYPTDSTANAAYLFRKRKTYYNYDQNDGFQIITEIHQRIKIYNKEGFKEANILISYYKPSSGKNEKISSLKGYSYNMEDSKIKNKSFLNLQFLTKNLPSIEVQKK